MPSSQSFVNAAYWVKLLEQQSLSRTEQEVVKRFSEDAGGRGFLPVADVLRSHKLIDESIELLTQGVQSHPGFAVARVVLARELYHRGLLMESWRCLDESPVALSDNVLAQKLIFKLALAFGDENAATAALKILKFQQGVDPEIKRLSEMLEMSGIVLTRDQWRKDLAVKGIHISIEDASIPPPPQKKPTKELPPPPGTAGAQASAQTDSRKGKTGPRNGRFILDYELDPITNEEISRYHVVPLSEVFLPGEKAATAAVPPGSRLELDSTTLAEIYAKQGHYNKALGIYRRLLRLSPHNDLIRMKVAELSRLEKEQRSEDIETDPAVYDRMEVVEIIDKQANFYNSLLNKLD